MRIVILFEKDKKFYLITGLCFLVIFIYWSYLQFLPSKDTLLNYFFNVIVAFFYLISGIISHLFYQKTNDLRLKNIFMLFGLSLFSYSLGNFIWAYYNIISRTEIPFPSLADLFYILYPIFIGAGFWYILDLFNFKPSKTNIKLSLIIVLLVFFIVFFIFNKPTIDNSQPVLTTLLNFFYPLSDSFLIALGIISFTAVGQISYGMFSIITALFFMAAGDITFSYRQTNKIYWNGDISDLLFLISVIFMITGIYRLYIKTNNNDLKLNK